MYKIRTSINDEIQANNIAHKLVSEKGAVSVHIRKINSIYQWNNQIEDVIEYEIEALTSNPQNANKIISKYHTYELPEIIISNVITTNELEEWCGKWCNNMFIPEIDKEKYPDIKQKYRFEQL